MASTAAPEMPIVDVTDYGALVSLCEQLSTLAVIAVDTEFERSRTFYPRLGLIQVSDGTTVWLIDPLRIDATNPLDDVLAAPNVVKVMHACGEDVEVLVHRCGVAPRPVFDTQLAEAFAGGRFGIGYRDLVSERLGVSLAKDETRSDWLARPLSASQRAYAAADVVWLLDIHAQQAAYFAAGERAAWHREECANLVAAAAAPPRPEGYYLGVRRASHLSPRQLAAFERLTVWREVTARDLDRPRAWIMKDEHLFQIAQHLPLAMPVLASMEAIPRGVVRRWGQALLAAVRAARDLPESALPARLPPTLTREDDQVVKRLAAVARQRARDVGIAEELLGRKKLIEQLVREKPGVLPEAFLGWRRDVVGDQLAALALAQQPPGARSDARGT